MDDDHAAAARRHFTVTAGPGAATCRATSRARRGAGQRAGHGVPRTRPKGAAMTQAKRGPHCSGARRMGIFVFDRVTMLDVSGPAEVLTTADVIARATRAHWTRCWSPAPNTWRRIASAGNCSTRWPGFPTAPRASHRYVPAHSCWLSLVFLMTGGRRRIGVTPGYWRGGTRKWMSSRTSSTSGTAIT